jgi:hypothetical protein
MAKQFQEKPMFMTARVSAGLLLLAVAASSQPSLAQPAPAAPAAAATQAVAVADFSQGFALLHRMGVTNVAKASYVTMAGPEMGRYLYARGTRQGLAGNAWQLSGNSTSGVFLINQTLVVRATTAPRVMTNRMDRAAAVRRMRYGLPDDEEDDAGAPATPMLHGVTWKPADLQADVGKLLERLQKDTDKYLAAQAKARPAGDDDDDPGARAMRAQRAVYGYDIGQWAACVLDAAHYADQGRLAEANRVAALAMVLGGGNQPVLEAVMSRLGNEAYQQVWTGFAKSGDWSAYAANLEALVARFPRGWPAVKEAAELARRVRSRTVMPAPLPAGLSDAGRALATELASANPEREADYAFQQSGFWLLPRDTNDFVGAWIATAPHPLARLLRGGTNSFPVLLAMTEDPATFTRVQTTGPLPATNKVEAVDENGEPAMPPDMMDPYASMHGGGMLARPALRSEIATRLLESIFGTEHRVSYSSRGRRIAGQEKPLAERVRAWQEEHAGMTTEGIAFACLAGKDYGLRNAAVQYLAASPSPSAWQRLEKHILEARELNEYLWVAQSYVSRRGKDAKPFVDALEARIAARATPTNAVSTAGAGGDEEELFKAGNHDDQYNKYRRQEEQRMLKELRRLVDARPFSALVDELIASTNLTAAKYELARNGLYRVPPAEALTNLVLGAVRAPSVAARLALLDLVSQQQGQRMYMEQYGGYEARQPDAEPAAASLQAAWQTLLADARVDAGAPADITSAPPAVRDAAALAFEESHPGAITPAMITTLQEAGSEGRALLLQRAQARLAGKPVPAFPDPERVSAARLAELTNGIPREAVDARAARIAALNADERLALARAAMGNASLAQALAPVAHRLRAVPPADAAAGVRDALQACNGKVLDRAVVQGLVQQCLALARQGTPVTFELRRAAGFGGTEITVHPRTQAEVAPGDDRDGVLITAGAFLRSTESMLCHTDAAPAPAAAVAEDPLRRPTDAELIAAEIARNKRGPVSPAEAEAAFWQRVANFAAGDAWIGIPGGLRLVAVRAAGTQK